MTRAKSKQIKDAKRKQEYIKKLSAPIYFRNDLLQLKSNVSASLCYKETYRSQLVKAVTSCALCGYSNINVLEVHHIDGNHSNNAWDNIAVVCANCHVLITKGKIDYWEQLNQKLKSKN